jgi:hypothetical protein
LPNRESFERTLQEFWRVTKPGAKVWLGECPFRDEIAYLNSLPVRLKTLARRVFRKLTLWKYRTRQARACVIFKKTLPTFHLPPAEVCRSAARLGWQVEVFPCVGTNFFPNTRVNYLLTRRG